MVPKLILAEQGIFSSKSGISDVRKLVENIIIRCNDTVNSVRQEGRKVLVKLKNQAHENFENLVRRLSHEHQDSLRKIITKEQQAIPEIKFLQVFLDEIADNQIDLGYFGSQQEYLEFIKSEVPQELDEILAYFPKKDTLYFGFIKQSVFIDCFDKEDIEKRQKAVQTMSEAFFYLANLESMRSFMSKFFKFIVYLLNDHSQTIQAIALDILQKVVDTPGIQVNTFLNICIPSVIDILNTELAHIRKKAFTILRILTKFMRRNTLLRSFTLFLDEKPKQWFFYQDLIHLVCYILLNPNLNKEMWWRAIFETNDQENEVQKSLNLKEIIFKIALFLDHKVPKLKQTAYNALCVLAFGIHRQQVNDFLHEILDQKVYFKLISDIERGEVYFINDQDLLELPHIPVKEFEHQLDEYDEHRRNLQALREMHQKEWADKLDREELAQYLLSQRQQQPEQKIDNMMTKRRQIQETNKLFDSFFNLGPNDNFKYDVVVPVNSIKMTEGDPADYYAKRVLSANKNQKKLKDFKPDYSNYDKTRKFNLNDEDQELVLDDIDREQLGIQSKSQQDFIRSQVQIDEKLKQNISLQEKDLEKKRDEEFKKQSQLQKNVYLYRPNVPIEYKTDPPTPDPEQPNYRLQYGKERDLLITKEKEDLRIQQMENINTKIIDSVKENYNKHNIYNIPLVVQANVNGYKGYKYDPKYDDKQDVQEIFLDYKKIKQEIKQKDLQNQKDEEAYRKYLEDLKEEEERKRKEEEKRRINYLMMPQQERYLKKMLQFIEHDEDQELLEKEKDKKQPGTYKPSKKQKRRMETYQQWHKKYGDDGVQVLESGQLPPLQNPLSDIKASSVNLRSSSWKVLFNTVTNLRCINKHNFELLFAPDINLKLLIEDMINLGDHLKQCVTINALLCMSEMVETLKEAINTNLAQMLTVALRRSLDKNQWIVDFSRNVLVQIGKYNDFQRILNIVMNVWDSRSPELKISVGLILEQIVQRMTYAYQNQNTKVFRDILALISSLCGDTNFQTRRLGKKVFFKLISGDTDHNLLIQQINNRLDDQLEKDLLIRYLNKFQEIFEDDKPLMQYREQMQVDYLQNMPQDNDITMKDKIFKDEYSDAVQKAVRIKRPNSHMLRGVYILENQ